jgi:hypothetical protein
MNSIARENSGAPRRALPHASIVPATFFMKKRNQTRGTFALPFAKLDAAEDFGRCREKLDRGRKIWNAERKTSNGERLPPNADCRPQWVDGCARTLDGRARTLDGRARTLDGRPRTLDGRPRTLTAPLERSRLLSDAHGRPRTRDRCRRTLNDCPRTRNGCPRCLEGCPSLACGCPRTLMPFANGATVVSFARGLPGNADSGPQSLHGFVSRSSAPLVRSTAASARSALPSNAQRLPSTARGQTRTLTYGVKRQCIGYDLLSE